MIINDNKEKLGEDVGQPGILTGDTRVSHTSPKAQCGMAEYSLGWNAVLQAILIYLGLIYGWRRPLCVKILLL